MTTEEFDNGAKAMREHIALITLLAGHGDLAAAILKTELPTEPDVIAMLDSVRGLLAMDAARPGLGGA